MTKAIIIDDEKDAAEMIKTLTTIFCPELIICDTSYTVKDAIKQILLYEPDIIFLDVELGDGLGFEILEHIQPLKPFIIFITAYEHYALKAIKANAFDYILKPIIPEEFKDSVKRVMDKIKDQSPAPTAQALLHYLQEAANQKVAVPSKNGLHYYNIKDIVLIEAEGNYSVIHFLNTKSVLITKKIKDFEDSLSVKSFLRIHKSFLINMNHISELHRDDSGYIVMSNQKRVPISPKNKEELIQRIKLFASTI